jgi:hypothetical protein
MYSCVVELTRTEPTQGTPRGARARDFVIFLGGKFMHRARAARACGFDSLPSRVLQDGTLPVL